MKSIMFLVICWTTIVILAVNTGPGGTEPCLAPLGAAEMSGLTEYTGDILKNSHNCGLLCLSQPLFGGWGLYEGPSEANKNHEQCKCGRNFVADDRTSMDWASIVRRYFTPTEDCAILCKEKEPEVEVAYGVYYCDNGEARCACYDHRYDAHKATVSWFIDNRRAALSLAAETEWPEIESGARRNAIKEKLCREVDCADSAGYYFAPSCVCFEPTGDQQPRFTVDYKPQSYRFDLRLIDNDDNCDLLCSTEPDFKSGRYAWPSKQCRCLDGEGAEKELAWEWAETMTELTSTEECTVVCQKHEADKRASFGAYNVHGDKDKAAKCACYDDAYSAHIKQYGFEITDPEAKRAAFAMKGFWQNLSPRRSSVIKDQFCREKYCTFHVGYYRDLHASHRPAHCVCLDRAKQPPLFELPYQPQSRRLGRVLTKTDENCHLFCLAVPGHDAGFYDEHGNHKAGGHCVCIAAKDPAEAGARQPPTELEWQSRAKATRFTPSQDCTIVCQRHEILGDGAPLHFGVYNKPPVKDERNAAESESHQHTCLCYRLSVDPRHTEKGNAGKLAYSPSNFDKEEKCRNTICSEISQFHHYVGAYFSSWGEAGIGECRCFEHKDKVVERPYEYMSIKLRSFVKPEKSSHYYYLPLLASVGQSVSTFISAIRGTPGF